ncbi:MAG: hypothetical protein ACHQSE_15915, partial [Gemmatimonadales bacterium]
AASAVYALKTKPKIFTDPFGGTYPNGTTHPHLATGVALGTATITATSETQNGTALVAVGP